MSDKIIDFETANDIKLFEKVFETFGNGRDSRSDLIQGYYAGIVHAAPEDFLGKLHYFLDKAKEEVSKMNDTFNTDSYAYHENAVQGCLEQLQYAAFDKYDSNLDIESQMPFDKEVLSLDEWSELFNRLCKNLENSINVMDETYLRFYCSEAQCLSVLVWRISK